MTKNTHLQNAKEKKEDDIYNNIMKDNIKE